MAWTQADRDKLAAAIATGARRVRFQTHEVEYQSMSDMRAVLAEMDEQLNPAGPAIRRTAAEYSSGV